MYSDAILLVEQPAATAASLRSRLEAKGYRVVEARDAAAAMKAVSAMDIGLVVTELYLRIGKARCLARQIGSSAELGRTKILAYTAHGRREDRAWARRIGADGYVITRSGEERFLSVVDHLMHAPSLPRRTTRQA